MSTWTKSLRNVFSALLNLCQQKWRKFWRQTGVWTLGWTLTLTWLSNIQVTHYLSDTWVSGEPATSNLEQPVWLFPGEYRWSCCMLQTTGTTQWLTLGDSPFSTLFMGQMIILFLLLRDFISFSSFVFLMGGGSVIAFVNYFKATVSFVFSPVFVADNVCCCLLSPLSHWPTFTFFLSYSHGLASHRAQNATLLKQCGIMKQTAANSHTKALNLLH